MRTNSKIYLLLLLIGFFLIAQTSCKKDEDSSPKPIAITSTITPSIIPSGTTAQYTITIENLGEAIVITRIHIKDEFVSGWAKDQPAQEMDLPSTDISFTEHETKIVFNQTLGPLMNTGINDVGIKNTVTAYFESGSVSKSIYYTLKRATTKLDQSGIQSLLGYISTNQ